MVLIPFGEKPRYIKHENGTCVYPTTQANDWESDQLETHHKNTSTKSSSLAHSDTGF